MQHLLEFFAAGQFLEAAPVLGAGGVLDLLFHRSEVKLLTLAGANVGACCFAFDRLRFVLFDAHRSFLISRTCLELYAVTLYRWQVLQLVISCTERTLYCCFKALPSDSWSE